MARRLASRLIAGTAAGAALLGLPAFAVASIDAGAPAPGAAAPVMAAAPLATAATLDPVAAPAPDATAAATDAASAGASAAGGPSLRLDQPCAVAGRSSLGLTATGWAPGADLSFWIGQTRIGRRTADEGGRVRTRHDLLAIPRLYGHRTVVTRRVRVRDRTGAVVGPVALRIVRRGVVLPKQARPDRRVVYRASGFPAGRRLYLHVRRGGHTQATVALGRPHGACGMLRARLPYVPVADAKAGAYEYWFTDTRHFRASKTLYGLLVEL